MQLITKKQDLIDNILTLEGYLTGKNKEEKKFAEDLVRNGKSLCVYKVGGENHFAPNRFLGFKNNNMANYLAAEQKEVKDTKPAITKIIGRPFVHDTIEKKFKDYAASLGLEVSANQRNYWRVKDERGKNLNIQL